jgi:hypothetical protein
MAGASQVSVGREGLSAALPSASCSWEALALPSRREWITADELVLREGWTRRWTAAWKYGPERSSVTCPVRDLAGMPVDGAQPVRRFSFRTGQHHRPGLHYMASTGRHHGCESRQEAQLLLALDFAGQAVEVLSQPFALTFTTRTGVGEHTPDFLAVTRQGRWLIDVRPAGRIRPEDRVRFAAAAEAALVCGWRYIVVTGWRPNVQTTLDTLSGQRRPVSDPLGLRGQLLAAVAGGQVSFGELVETTSVPAAARAYALHLIWHRRLGIDLAVPLTDTTPVTVVGIAETEAAL